MRASFLFIFCLFFAGLAVGQLQFASTPAYSRAPITNAPDGTLLNVIGANNNVIYGAGGCAPSTICLYRSNTFAPESWVSFGQILTPDGSGPYGILFPPGPCSNYVYVYTENAHIYRSSGTPGDWTFPYDVSYPNPGANLSGLPNRTSDATFLAGSMVALDLGSTTRLFAGKYSNSPTNAQAQIWYSDDCGNTWANSYPNPIYDQNDQYSFGCREIHSLGIDPATGYVYANVDCEIGDKNQWGLWQSVNSGNTFEHVQPGNSNAGLQIYFPTATSRVFIGADVTPSAPLLFWDKVNGGTIQSCCNPSWPNPAVSNEPSWAVGLDIGVKVTSEQNIFSISTQDTTANPPTNRSGAWYFAPPFYDTPVLLEDLAPPIEYLTLSAGTVTVTTFEPNGIQTGDEISINGVSHDFDAMSQFRVVAVQNSKTFTYPCSACPSPPANVIGSAATKTPGFNMNTVEVTGSNNVTYLYSTTVRFVKPLFITPPLPASGSAIANILDSNGGEHWTYIGSNQHVYDVFWHSGTGIGFTDLTYQASAPLAATGSALSSIVDSGGTLHFIYLGTNQHVYQIMQWPGPSFNYEDRTATTGAPTAAAGSALTSLIDSDGAQHFVYTGTNQHLYDAYWNGSLGYTDLTSASLAPVAAAGSKLTSYQVGSQLQWYFLAAYNHVDHILCTVGSSSCSWEDLTSQTGAPPAAAGSALTTFADSNGGSHWAYLGTNQHLYEGYWTGSFGSLDLTSAASAPLAAAGSALTSYQNGAQWQWYYLDPNGQMEHILCNSGGSGCVVAWITAATTAPGAAAGSPITSFFDSNGGQHWTYMGANQHIYDLFWNGGYGFHDLHAR